MAKKKASKKKASKKTRKSVLNKSVIEMRPAKKSNIENWFIPAGALIGLGIGFLYQELLAGLFLGLGIGFLVEGLILLTKKRKK